MIYGIEGQFGSGKTSLASYIARKRALETAKAIASKHQGTGHVIFTNIKFNDLLIPNAIYFEDNKFLDVLRMANAVNDYERLSFYSRLDLKSSLNLWHRDKFTRYLILYDEATALQNNRMALENAKLDNNAQEEYIMQNRKNMEDVYIMGADGNQNDKSLRRHVDWWYTIKPLTKIPFFRDIVQVHRHKKDQEGNLLMIPYVGKDDRGEYVKKEKPSTQYVDWFYKPGTYKLYDDLHKNIKDINKYNIDPLLLKRTTDLLGLDDDFLKMLNS